MATFHSNGIALQVDVALEGGDDEDKCCPMIEFQEARKVEMPGTGITARIHIHEGEAISFIIREDKANHVTKDITTAVVDLQQHDTQTFWYEFISQMRYKGRWREVVARSLMLLKMMTYGKPEVHFVFLIKSTHGSQGRTGLTDSSHRTHRCHYSRTDVLDT